MTSYRKQLYWLLTPYLLGTLLLVGVPALATFLIAFTDYKVGGIPQWVGLDKFRLLFDSSLVRLSLRNSLLFLLGAVPLRLGVALLFGLLLQKNMRLFGLYRAAVYLPTVIPEAGYALLWLWIFNPLYGPLNMVLNTLGLPAPAWLTEPSTAVVAMIIMSAFQIGEGFVVVLAGLQSIPRNLFEAAKVDGANNWQTFWEITLPLLTPWLLLLTFRDLLISLQNTFAPTFIMTYGGPYYATTFVPLLVYEVAFDLFDFGLAAALLVLFYIVLGLLIIGVANLVGIQGKANAT